MHYATESLASLEVDNYSAVDRYKSTDLISTKITTLKGLSNTTPYYFVVTAFKADDQSQASAQISATPNKLAASKLNDTGLNWGGNYPAGRNQDCTGETISQQDCSHGRDAQAAAGTLTKVGAGHAGFDFTRLNADGSEYQGDGNYETAPWACVRDNHTGLIWEVKTKDGGIHDQGNSYRWGGKTARGSGYGEYYSDWDVLIDDSNAEKLCGFSNWRVPSRNEVMGLVNYAEGDWRNREYAVDTSYFPNIGMLYYWTSSPIAQNSDSAWIVIMLNGAATTELLIYAGSMQEVDMTNRIGAQGVIQDQNNVILVNSGQ